VTAEAGPASVRFPKSELPEGGRKVIKIGRRPVVVINADGELFALFSTCPHHRAPLDKGPLGRTTVPSSTVGEFEYGERVVLRCPWHGYEFDLATGRCLADPDRFRVRTYDVREEGDEIVVSA
jgi:nitrite reductase (NADH) small subunit